MPPSVVADGFGRSAPTSARNVGAAAAPVVGPARSVFALCVASVSVTAPVLVLLFVTVPSPVMLATPPIGPSRLPDWS